MGADEAIIKIATWVHLADMCCERTSALIAGCKLEVVIPCRVVAKAGVVLRGCEHEGGTTLPATDESCTHEIGGFLGSSTVKEELVKLRHKLR